MPQLAGAAAAWAVTAWTSAVTVVNTAMVAAAGAALPGLSFGAQLAVANFATKAVVFGGLAAASAALMRPNIPSSGTSLDFKPDPKAPIRGAMGYTALGGNKVFQATWGYKRVAMSLGVALSLGPIDQVPRFEADGATVSFSGPQNEATGFYAADMWQRTTLGLPGDAALLPPTGLKYGNPGLTGWGTQHAAPQVSFSFWTMVLAKNPEDRDVFTNGVPDPRWIGRWMKLWDPRKDSTYPGGSGSQRRDDWRTWGWTENPYVHALAWVRGHHKLNLDGTIDRGKRIAGVGAPDAAVDIPAFVEGMNIADANAWTISGEWSTGDGKFQTLLAMLQAGGGEPISRGAQISVMVNAPRVATYTYTRDDLIGQAEIRPLTPRRERKNTVVPRYKSEANGWQYVPAGEVTSSVYRDEDRGEPRSLEIEYTHVRDAKQAGQLAAYDLANLREGLTATLPSKVHLMHVHPGDCITVDVPELALAGQKFIVRRATVNHQAASVTLELRSESDGKHAWALGQAAQPAPSPSLSAVDPKYVPPPADEDWTVVPKPPGDGGVSQPIFIIEAPVETTDIVAVIIKHGPSAEGPWTDGYEGSPRADGRYEVAGLTPGQTYCVSLQYVAKNGAKSDPSIKCGVVAGDLIAGDTTHVGGRPLDEIPALDTTPPAVPAALALSSSSTPDAAGNPYVQISATWDANTEDDLNGYDVEITEAGFSVVAVTTANRYSRPGLTGRIYTIRVRAFDKAGNRSAWSSSKTVTGAGDTTPPAAPTAFSVNVSLGAFFLAWTNPTVSDLSKIEVWEGATSNSANATLIATVNAQSGAKGSYARSGMSGGDTRWFWLKAVDTSGNASVFSASATGTIPHVPAGEIDTTPPGVPTALSLTTSALVDAGTGLPRIRVAASWTAPSDSDLAGFDVEVTEGGGNPITRMVSAARDQWDSRPNVSYSVRVRAFDRVGNRSGWSAPQSVTSALDTTPPNGPTGFAISASLGAAFLSWSNAANADLDRVEVWENTTNDSATAQRIATVNAQPSASGGYARSGLEAGSVRYYWLKSVDTSGNASGFSIVRSVTIPHVPAGEIDTTPPGVPTALSLTTSALVDAGTGLPRIRVAASWTAPSDSDLAGFDVEVTEGGGNPITRMVSAARDQWDSRPNISYLVRVRAFDRVGNRSAWSGPQTITSPTDSVAPAPPTALAAVASVGAVFLSGQAPADLDVAKIEIWENTTNSSATATRIAVVNAIPGRPWAHPRTGLSANDTRWFWARAVDTSGNVSAFSTGISCTVPYVANPDIAVGTLAGDRILAQSLEGSVFKTNTSLPGTITVGASGVTIETIRTQANDPAARINAGPATKIDPGKITLWGGGSLSDLPDWRMSGDVTQIDGGKISANTIRTNSLEVGLRGVESSLTFSANDPATNQVSWTAGTVSYVNDAGATVSTAVAAGNTPILSAFPRALNFNVVTGAITVSTVEAAHASPSAVILAIYYGGKDLITNYGRTIIEGDYVRTGTLETRHHASGSITSPLIAAGAVNATHVNAETFDGSVFKTNTSLPGTITVGTTGVTIETINTRADDPAARINAGPATKIDPGKVTLWGAGSLSDLPDWRMGGDVTRIDGGKISANTVKTNSLEVGLRGVESSLTFSANDPATNRVSWSAGTVSYVNDAGATVSTPVAAGNTPVLTVFPRALSFNVATGAVSISTVEAAHASPSAVILAIYYGGKDLITNYGRTIIEGDYVRTGTLETRHHSSGSITSPLIAAGAVNATHVNAETFEGSVFKTNTSLPGTITVGASGVTIETVRTQAANPAATINGGTTKIDPGQITISGTSTLASWRHGTDQTKIDGGSIFANSIKANVVEIGLRGVDTDVEFSANTPSLNRVSWSAGTVSYIGNDGATVSVAVSAGSTPILSAFPRALNFNVVTGAITVSTLADANASANAVTLAVYSGGTNLAVNYGRTLIDGDSIKTRTVKASHVDVETLSAIAADLGTVTSGRIQNAAGTTFWDLTNGRSQHQVGAYVWRQGSIGSGVVTWFGPSAVPIGSETRTNGAFATGTDGRPYLGTEPLENGGNTVIEGPVIRGQSRTFNSSNMTGGSWVSAGSVTLTEVPAGSNLSFQLVSLSGDISPGTTFSGEARILDGGSVVASTAFTLFPEVPGGPLTISGGLAVANVSGSGSKTYAVEVRNTGVASLNFPSGQWSLTTSTVATSSQAGMMSPQQAQQLADLWASGGGGGVALATTAPASVGVNNAVGTGTTAARADHVHAHGNQAGGGLHALATTSAHGFMSSADKIKLNSISAGATANSPESAHASTGTLLLRDPSSGAARAQVFAANTGGSTVGGFTIGGRSLYANGDDLAFNRPVSSPAFNPVCDLDLKENVQPVTDDLAALGQVLGAGQIEYDRTQDGAHALGFAAQALRDINPLWVVGGEPLAPDSPPEDLDLAIVDGDGVTLRKPLTVDPMAMISSLFAALRQNANDIGYTEMRLLQVLNRVDALEAEMAAMKAA